VNCNHHVRAGAVREEAAALFLNSDGAAEHRLRRRGAHAHDQLGAHGFHFRFEPWTAGRNFAGTRFLVDAALAFGFEFEVLHRVSDIHLVPANARLFEGAIQQFPRGSNKRMPLEILLIAGPFPHQHDACRGMPFAEDRLRGEAVEIAAVALARGVFERMEAARFRQKFRRGMPICRWCFGGMLHTLEMRLTRRNFWNEKNDRSRRPGGGGDSGPVWRKISSSSDSNKSRRLLRSSGRCKNCSPVRDPMRPSGCCSRRESYRSYPA